MEILKASWRHFEKIGKSGGKCLCNILIKFREIILEIFCKSVEIRESLEKPQKCLALFSEIIEKF